MYISNSFNWKKEFSIFIFFHNSQTTPWTLRINLIFCLCKGLLSSVMMNTFNGFIFGVFWDHLLIVGNFETWYHCSVIVNIFCKLFKPSIYILSDITTLFLVISIVVNITFIFVIINLNFQIIWGILLIIKNTFNVN